MEQPHIDPELTRPVAVAPPSTPTFNKVLGGLLAETIVRETTLQANSRGCAVCLDQPPPLAFNNIRYEIKPTCLGLRQPVDALA